MPFFFFLTKAALQTLVEPELCPFPSNNGFWVVVVLYEPIISQIYSDFLEMDPSFVAESGKFKSTQCY